MALPSSIKVPGTNITIDASRAATGALVGPSRSVLIGQMTSAGTATAEDFIQIFSSEDAAGKFGRGSMLAEMFTYWFAGNEVTEVYAVPLDDAAGTAATFTQTLTGTATEAGTVYLYINGTLVQIGVSDGDTATVVGDAVETAIGTTISAADYPVTASNAAGVVTFTAKNLGTVSSTIDIRQNLLDTQETPAGLTSVIAVAVSGATDPDVDDAIAAVPDELINWWISPYVDSTSTGKVTTELARRWGNTVQLDGHAIIGSSGATATVVTFGGTLNDEHLTVIDSGQDSPTPDYLWAPAFTAPIAIAIDTDVAQPVKTLTIELVVGDTASNKRKFAEQNSLLNAGISTHIVGSDGAVTIQRAVTTHKTTSIGTPTTAYLNLNTLTNLSFQRQSLINMVAIRFPRHKLANDGTNFGSGQPIVTPSSMKAEIANLYELWIDAGIVEDLEEFTDTMVVERDTADRSRLNATLNPILVGQFYILDATLQFIL